MNKKAFFLLIFIGLILFSGCLDVQPETEEQRAIKILKSSSQGFITEDLFQKMQLRENCTFEKYLNYSSRFFGAPSEEDVELARTKYENANNCLLFLERKIEKTGESQYQFSYKINLLEQCPVYDEDLKDYFEENKWTFNVNLSQRKAELVSGSFSPALASFTSFNECTSQAMTLSLGYGETG